MCEKTKIRILIQIILITLAIHSTGYASSKTLWDQAEHGMTPAQVLKVFPDAKKNPNPDFVQLSKSTSKVVIPSKRIHNIDFEVSFFFNSTGLVQVTLSSRYTSNQNAQFLNSLLTQKYGQPVKVWQNSCYKDIVWYDAPLSIDSSTFISPCYEKPRIIIIYNHSRHDAMNSL